MEDNLKEKGFKIIFWNTRSVLKKIDSIRDKVHLYMPNIVAVTESWLKDNIPNSMLDIAGYNIYRQDRKFANRDGRTKRGGGLLLYMRNDLLYDNVVGDSFNINDKDVEITTFKINRPHTRKLYMILVYRPPNGNIAKAIEHLNNLTKLIPNLDTSDIIIGGDFNIDFSRPRKEDTKKLKHFSTKNNLTQHINDPTRPIDSNAIIDLIFSNCRHVKYTGVLPWNISDHVPVFILIKKDKTPTEKTEFTGRSYRNFDEHIFMDMIRGYEWEIFYNKDTEINRKWDILYENVLKTLNVLIPVKTFKFRKSKPEWMAGDLIEYMKDRDVALKKATRTKDPNDKRLARRARNRVNLLIRNAKNDFVKEKLENYSDNPKKFWQQIKSVMPELKFSNHINLLDMHGNKLNNLESANKINFYFANIGSDLAKDIVNKNQNIMLPPNPPDYNINTLTLTKPLQNDIQFWVKKIQVFKSSGIPLISSRIWKLLFTDEPLLLYTLVETIFNKYEFPQVWKSATVIPLPKIAKIIGPEDLRPISLLPLPGKIVEHLIYYQIDKYLEINNLLTNRQNGFRSKRSTTQTIFDYTTDLFNIYNQDNETIAIYIDFKKAFDTVNHKKLIEKFKKYNFDQNLIKLLASYLQNRNQCTCVEGKCSDMLNITYGVPQGSILGPKLFLLYINDLTSVIKNCEYYLYADDIVMFRRLRPENVGNDFAVFEEDVQSVSNWCVANELTINIKKTKLQYFPKNRNSDCNLFENTHIIRIDQQKITYENSFKYLGIEIDKNINMKGQFEYLYKIVNHKLFLLRIIRPCLTINAALNIARSMILSLIDYGNIFLTSCTQKDKSDLQILQNKILRCCLKINDPLDQNILEMHNLLNLLTVDQRRILQLLILIKKSTLQNKLELVDHDRETRQNDGLKIKLPIPKNQHVRYAPFYVGSVYWNALPLRIRNLDINKFKSEIKKMIVAGTLRLPIV